MYTEIISDGSVENVMITVYHPKINGEKRVNIKGLQSVT